MGSRSKRGTSKSAAKRDDSRVDKQLARLSAEIVNLKRKSEIAFENDAELAKNADNHDVQFCVMMRIFISTMNQVIGKVNASLPAEADKVPELSYAGVNAEFVEFTKFRSRPLFRNFMAEWFMGEDVSELGFAEESDGTPGAEDEDPEGAVEFGGDYGENQRGNGDGSADSVEAQDEVPEVPPADEELGGPEDGAQGVAVSEGRDGDEAHQEAGVVTPPDPSSSAAP